MKKIFAALYLCGVGILATAGNAGAAQIYHYAEPGSNGVLKLEDNPDGTWLSIETANEKGHTCEVSGYECVLNGSQYTCTPHEGDDPGEPPIILDVSGGKTLIVRQAPGAKSPDGMGANFCGATGAITGKYTRK